MGGVMTRYTKYLGLAILTGAGCATSEDADDPVIEQVDSPVMTAFVSIGHDVSPPLRDATPFMNATEAHARRPRRLIGLDGPVIDDPVVQTVPGPAVAVIRRLNFPGVGNGDYGFTPDSAPPDTNGVAGATQYVQWVNESFAVFDKITGAIAPGFPKAGNTVFAGFTPNGLTGCQNNNDGDPIVQYDKAAQRWILTQFSVSTLPFLQCVAVSTTSDATGSYNRYAFQYADFPDYPKLGVWTDAYYISFNMFEGFTGPFLGANACAYDRSAMLTGAATATQICFQQPLSVESLLPSDLDGRAAPPRGSPAFFANINRRALNVFKFKVHSFSPPSASFTHAASLPISFTPACPADVACVPQRGTKQRLDALSDRLMYRLAYRNFGDHEAMVVNHAVSTGHKNASGIRWYELRSPGTGRFSIFQQGTFAPDTSWRWMGSIAMDKIGDIAVGYSVSSSTIHPGIRYAVRRPRDRAGTLGAEISIKEGAGSQLPDLNRWGDYSAMSIDPVDDCTFFYTNEYLKATGTFNWSTQIASFKVAGCY
jgi:hypothetical protein